MLKLVVILRDISAFIHLQEPVDHRRVEIELTPEQVQQLKLKWTGSNPSGQGDIHESVSMCFLEGDFILEKSPYENRLGNGGQHG